MYLILSVIFKLLSDEFKQILIPFIIVYIKTLHKIIQLISIESPIVGYEYIPVVIMQIIQYVFGQSDKTKKYINARRLEQIFGRNALIGYYTQLHGSIIDLQEKIIIHRDNKINSSRLDSFPLTDDSQEHILANQVIIDF
jgi:hypothetical protein